MGLVQTFSTERETGHWGKPQASTEPLQVPKESGLTLRQMAGIGRPKSRPRLANNNTGMSIIRRLEPCWSAGL